MKTIDRSWTSLPWLPDAFCWSTWIATSPARCAWRPAGSPACAIFARSPSTRSVCWFWLPPPCTASATSCTAWPSGERPASSTRLMPGTVRSWRCKAVTAVRSAAESCDPGRAITTGTGCRLAVPNGAASSAACSLGALAGRNLELLFWVTLDNAGSCETAPIAATIQNTRTSHLNRTAKRPIALKIASICIARKPT